jgi:hypothetical protein
MERSVQHYHAFFFRENKIKEDVCDNKRMRRVVEVVIYAWSASQSMRVRSARVHIPDVLRTWYAGEARGCCNVITAIDKPTAYSFTLFSSLTLPCLDPDVQWCLIPQIIRYQLIRPVVAFICNLHIKLVDQAGQCEPHFDIRQSGTMGQLLRSTGAEQSDGE